MQIGETGQLQVMNCLADVRLIVPINIYKSVNGKLVEISAEDVISPDLYLDVHNSDYGINSLKSFFGCVPSPYLNIIAAVKNACERSNIPYPSWFDRKYTEERPEKRRSSRISQRQRKKPCC